MYLYPTRRKSFDGGGGSAALHGLYGLHGLHSLQEVSLLSEAASLHSLSVSARGQAVRQAVPGCVGPAGLCRVPALLARRLLDEAACAASLPASRSKSWNRTTCRRSGPDACCILGAGAGGRLRHGAGAPGRGPGAQRETRP